VTRGRRLDAFVWALGVRARRSIGRIPPAFVIVSVLLGSWWLDRDGRLDGTRFGAQTHRHVAAARRTGRIVWVAELGRHIASGEVVARLDGNESSAEVVAPAAGCVSAVLKRVGDLAAAGEAVVVVAASLDQASP
jgi:multidrug resistance efflux pump